MKDHTSLREKLGRHKTERKKLFEIFCTNDNRRSIQGVRLNETPVGMTSDRPAGI